MDKNLCNKNILKNNIIYDYRNEHSNFHTKTKIRIKKQN